MKRADADRPAASATPGFAHRRPVDLASAANLIVATFELSVVRGVVNAIQTADIASGRLRSAAPLGPDPTPDVVPRLHLRPAATYEPREHLHPSPCDEDRAPGRSPAAGGAGVPGYEPCREPQFNAAACGWVTADAVKPACPNEQPIPPVWKQLPPVPAHRVGGLRRVVKVVRQQPDIHHRGALVDIHI